MDQQTFPIDWKGFLEHLKSKYSETYVNVVFHYCLKYHHLMNNISGLDQLPNTIKANVLKSLVVLAKYLGEYENFRNKLKQFGIRCPNNNNAVNSFLRILKTSNSDILQWYVEALNVLNDNEKLFLRLLLTTGIRKVEGLKCFNKIVTLAQSGRLNEYYGNIPNTDVKALLHFKFPKEFIRGTKNVFISFIPENLVNAIANSKHVSYATIRKRLAKNNLRLRLNELRDYFGTYLLNSGIQQQYIDMLQGRIPVNIFIRHYMIIFNLQELKDKVLNAIDQLEKSLYIIKDKESNVNVK